MLRDREELSQMGHDLYQELLENSSNKVEPKDVRQKFEAKGGN